MLRITVEIVPFGVEKNSRILSILEVWNEGRLPADLQKDDETWCSYGAKEILHEGDNAGAICHWLGVSHNRKKGYWDLLHRLLHANLGPLK